MTTPHRPTAGPCPRCGGPQEWDIRRRVWACPSYRRQWLASVEGDAWPLGRIPAPKAWQ